MSRTTAPDAALGAALQALEQALDAPRRPGVPLGNWRWVVRQRLTGLRDALVGEAASPTDGWLAARGGSAFRERNALLGRIAAAAPRVLDTPDVEAIRVELKRLAHDAGRHAQRLHDLAYDDVEIEFGGSD